MATALDKHIHSGTYPMRAGMLSLFETSAPDFYNIDGVSSGLRFLDRTLSKWERGTVNLIAGAEGSGKSSFCMHLCIHMIETYKRRVFLWSGEMSSGQLSRQLQLMVAGPKHLQFHSDTTCQYPEFKDKNDKLRIAEYYGDSFVLYNMTWIPAQNRAYELKMAMLEAVQNGIREIFLDNLQILVDMYKSSTGYARKGWSDFEYQGLIMNELVAFAVQHNVTVFLVVHTKKHDATGLDSANKNSMISGNSAIKDLASTIVFYDRPSDSQIATEAKRAEKEDDDPRFDQNDRLISVTKNRTFGHTSVNKIIARFDPLSHRIYTDLDDYRKDLSWVRATEGLKLDFKKIKAVIEEKTAKAEEECRKTARLQNEYGPRSKGEMKCEKTLQKLCVRYKTEYIFSDRYYKSKDNPLRDDFAILGDDDEVLATIEFNGEQHDRPVDFDHPEDFEGELSREDIEKIQTAFEEQKERDRIKTEYLASRGIPQLVIPYSKMDEVETIICDFLRELSIIT